MFGAYRYVLATAVVFTHLWGYAHYPGIYAVLGFFVLSGYLMTLVLNRTYGFSGRGVARYLANRFLRVFPPYLVVLLCAVVLVVYLPDAAHEVQRRMVLPDSPGNWLRNVLLLPISLRDPRLVPQAWSLTIELFFYAAMALVLARGRRRVLLWFAASLIYWVYVMASGEAGSHYNLEARYFTILGGSLPFSTGAMIFYHKDALRKIPRWPAVLAASALLSLVLVAPNFAWGENVFTLARDPYAGGTCAALLANACLVLGLSEVGKANAPPWLIRADGFLGNLAYPIFLCHFAAGAVLLSATGVSRKTGELFFLGLALTNVAGWVLHTLVEKRIDRFRGKVREPEKPSRGAALKSGP